MPYPDDNPESRALSKSQGVVHEFGMISMQNGGWNTKSLTVGGMKFKWNTADSSNGTITYIRADATDAPLNVPGTQQMHRISAGIQSISHGYENNLMWSNVLVVGGPSFIFNASYQIIKIDMCTRVFYGPTPSPLARWYVELMETGASDLVITVNYYGPAYTS